MVADRDAASRQRCLRGNRPTHWHSCLHPTWLSFFLTFPCSASSLFLLPVFVVFFVFVFFFSCQPTLSCSTRCSSFSTFLDTFVRHGPPWWWVTSRWGELQKIFWNRWNPDKTRLTTFPTTCLLVVACVLYRLRMAKLSQVLPVLWRVWSITDRISISKCIDVFKVV